MAKENWPKTCGIVFFCDTVANGIATRARLRTKFGDAIDSAEIRMKGDSPYLEIITRKIPENVYKSILEDLGNPPRFEIDKPRRT